MAVLRDHYSQLKRACLWGAHYLPSRYWGLMSPLAFMQYSRSHIFHPLADFVDENLMDQAKSRGWTVYPWAFLKGKEDDDKEVMWQTLKDLQVDGFCTNYPREFSQWQRKVENDERLT